MQEMNPPPLHQLADRLPRAEHLDRPRKAVDELGPGVDAEDGHLLATGSWDRTVKLWDATPLAE